METIHDPKKNTGEKLGSYLLDSQDSKNIINNMSPEEQARYRNAAEKFYGKSLYEATDFDSVTNNGVPPQFKEGVAYVTSMLNSGMHPSMLQENEKMVMKDTQGPTWYVKWGYTAEDLTSIVNPFNGVQN